MTNISQKSMQNQVFNLELSENKRIMKKNIYTYLNI